MSRKYKIKDDSQLYFVTFTVIHWIDVFIRDEYKQIFINSVRYCQDKKGLQVGAWCIMPSHVHLILGTDGHHKLKGIVRDLKSFTSRSIRKMIENNAILKESRSDWMVPMMYKAGLENSNNNDFQFWQQHNHPIELSSKFMTEQKLEYIHLNPVVAGFVDVPEAWLYSSARDYSGTARGLIDLVFVD